MICERIEIVDPDQQEAVTRALPIAALLAVERAKAWPRNINQQHEHRHRIAGFVRDLEMLVELMPNWTANELERTALAELRTDARRRGQPGPPKPVDEPVDFRDDPELRALERALLDAQIAEQSLGTRLSNMRRRFLEAKDATAEAARAVDAHRAAHSKGASK